MINIPESIKKFWAEDISDADLPVPEGFICHFSKPKHGPSIEYQSFTPDSSDRLPLVVVMTGTHHENNETHDLQLRNYAVSTLAHPDFPVKCHIIAPWNPTPGHPKNDEPGRDYTRKFAWGLSDVITDYIREYRVDTGRVYYIGVGGGGQYQMPSCLPDLWAAIAMNTSVFDYFADGQEDCYLEALGKVPVYLSHGVCDKPNPVKRSHREVRLFTEAGNQNILYREYSEEELKAAGADLDSFGGAHNTACRLPFLSEEFYDYLFSFTRDTSGDEIPHVDYPRKEDWDHVLLSGMKIRDHIADMGGPDFSIDKYINSYLGQKKISNYETTVRWEGNHLNPEVIEFWKNQGKGLYKERHEGRAPYKEWYTYVPMSAVRGDEPERLYPLMFVLHGSVDCGFRQEDTGYIQMAAEKEIIIVTPETEACDYVAEMFEECCRLYPVDRSRVYCEGFSYGGMMTYQNLIINTEIFAAGNIGGTAPGGPSMSNAALASIQKGIEKNSNALDMLEDIPYYVEKHKDLGIAMIHTGGVTEARYPFPLSRDPWGPQGGTIGRYKIDGVNQLCKMTGISEYDYEEVKDSSRTSENICERIIGLTLDKTWIDEIHGIVHYCGQREDKNGVPVLRYVATENCPHNCSPTIPEVVWDFFRMFRRDPETHRLIYDGKKDKE